MDCATPDARKDIHGGVPGLLWRRLETLGGLELHNDFIGPWDEHLTGTAKP